MCGRSRDSLDSGLLDRRLQTEPFAIAYRERMNSGLEPLFIKNLENVQGDERDVIFIFRLRMIRMQGATSISGLGR